MILYLQEFKFIIKFTKQCVKLQILRLWIIEITYMKITDPINSHTMTAEVEALHRSTNGDETPCTRELLSEHNMLVYINETPTFSISCSPGQLSELVLGRLLSEGIIDGAEDVDRLYLCEDGYRARVYLNKDTQPKKNGFFVETVATCCTDNKMFNDDFVVRRELLPVTPIEYKDEWIHTASAAMRNELPLYSITHSAHSCILIRNGDILTVSEDIGRHNAMDKVIGWAIRNGVDLKQCIIFTSGRVPVDMTRKAIRAGVPVLASKATPTEQSVILAKKYGLTLIGAAYSDGLKVFA